MRLFNNCIKVIVVKKNAEKQCGIVIKSYLPGKQKLIVLDQYHGKVEMVPNVATVYAGMHVIYTRMPAAGSHYFMNDVEIIDVPCELVQHDLLFLHHIFELCLYGIPFGNCAQDVYELLVRLYNMQAHFKNSYNKKIFLFKLLQVIGMHPDSGQDQALSLNRLTFEPLDILLHETIDLEVESALDIWLTECIIAHPYNRNFKTVHFLAKNRVV